MPLYQKDTVIIHAFQVGGTGPQDLGAVLSATADPTDWIIKSSDGTLYLMTDTLFTAKYNLLTGSAALTGDDIT